MFWGLIMEPQRRYTQQVKKAFHISMAALDFSTSSDEPAQVMCGFEGRNYLLCTLQKPGMVQCQLDLNFDVGSEVSFAANGKCHVHLTGYLTEEFSLDEGEEEGEEEEEEIEEVKVENIINKKRSKLPLDNQPPSKKSKNGLLQLVTSSQNNEESDDSSDDSFLPKELGSDDEEDNSGEEEQSDQEEESGEEEEDWSSMSENETEEEKAKVDSPSTSNKVNGVNNSNKKNKAEKTRNSETQKQTQQKEVKTPNKENPTPKKKMVQGGVAVEDIKEGQGQLAKKGSMVTVYYEGRLKQNNKLFDATKKGAGFSFRLGAGEVIKAWDVGVAGMKIGGKRRLICPPSMAYGQKGSPPAIPPNSTLVFEVELRKVR